MNKIPNLQFDSDVHEFFADNMPAVVVHYGHAKRWQDSVSKRIPRGLLVEDQHGNQLLVQSYQERYNPTIYISGLWANPTGCGLGTLFMETLKMWLDIHGLNLEVGLVANHTFFRRFDWLTQQGFVTYAYESRGR